MVQRLLGGRVIGCGLGTPEAGQKGLFPSVWGVAGALAMEGGTQVAIGAVELCCTKFCPGPCPGAGGAQLAFPPVAALGAPPEDEDPGCVLSSPCL